MIIRQGDVLLTRVGECASSEQTRELTLAIGEQSGHSHVLHGGVEVLARGHRYVDVPRDTTVTIEGMPWRHAPVMLPSGRWEIVVEREYSPEAVRNVQD